MENKEKIEGYTGQKSFTDYRALVLSYELREAQLGILNPGCYAGYDTLHIYENKLGITHEKSGIVKTIYKPVEEGGGVGVSKPTGVFITKFGTIIHDDTEISIPKPTEDGTYLVYAKYLRPTAGDEYTVMVHVTYLILSMTDIKGETDIKKLGETDTPITVIRKKGTEFTLFSNQDPDITTTDGKHVDVSFIDTGILTNVELLTSMGTLGVGRFKYLGRTLNSIFTFLADQTYWNVVQESWNRMLINKLDWPKYPNGSIDDDKKFLVKFISSTFTIWNDLVILDKELQNLWNKLGYPGEQPESEKVLLIANTVWQNMLALEKYSTDLSDDIWTRMGLSKGDVSEIHDVIDKAETIWNNLLALMTKLKALDDHVRTDNFDNGGIQANLNSIWLTLGYNVDKDTGKVGVLSKRLSVWDNLANLTNYISEDVVSNNDFIITQLIANAKGVFPTIKLGESVNSRKTFLWEISQNRNTSEDIRDFTLNLLPPWQDDKMESRVALIAWRPTKAGLRLYITGGVTQATSSPTQELYISNGGMALLYKLTKNQPKWNIQILNSGSTGGGGGAVTYESKGLMPGYEKIVDKSPWSGPTSRVPSNQGMIRVSTEVGVSEIDYNQLSYKMLSGDPNWGNKSTYYIALARPTEDQLGSEKIIRIGGSPTDHSPDITNPQNTLDPGFKQRNISPYNNRRKKMVCLNFSLPMQTVLPTGLYTMKTSKTVGGTTYDGIITNWDGGSYLKWPGDWVRLRAEGDPSDGSYIWRIIETGYNPNNRVLLCQQRWGQDYKDMNNGNLNSTLEGMEFFISNDDRWRMNTSPYMGNRPYNAFAEIVGRNRLVIQIPLDYSGGNGGTLIFHNAVPWPSMDDVGQMRIYQSKGYPYGYYWGWAANPNNNNYGAVKISTWDGKEVLQTDWGWEFPLGGPCFSFMNYVMHGVNFEEA